ncbi:MAG TPA: hypothetical protein VJU84_14580 [Pyrinomonadaceae bacterium]|nr:hypothetical protein [Pyrinomonadaceae bacterium]
MKLRLLTLIIFLALTIGLYYWASDPHSLWILWVTIPALLIGLAVELMKKRKATT